MYIIMIMVTAFSGKQKKKKKSELIKMYNLVKVDCFNKNFTIKKTRSGIVLYVWPH